MYTETVIRDDPVGYWKLDDKNTVARTLKDYSKNLQDGFLTGGYDSGQTQSLLGGFGSLTRVDLSITTDLTLRCGANSHWSFTPSIYRSGIDGKGNTANPDVVAGFKQIGFAFWRERLGNNNSGQVDVMAKIPNTRALGFPGVLTDSQTSVNNTIAFWAKKSRDAGHNLVLGFCGPNEINSKKDNGDRQWGATWAADSVKFMSWVKTSVQAEVWPDGDPLIIAPVLKHEHVPLDDDIAELAAATFGGHTLPFFCDVGDFHFYSGGNGPGYRMNGQDSNHNVPPGLILDSDGKIAIEKFELYRARQVYGDPNFPMVHTEWGYTSGQSNPNENQAAIYIQETYLRDYNLGILYSSIYETVNELSGGKDGWFKDATEGQFGQFDVRDLNYQKPSYNATNNLLTNYTGGQQITGKAWLTQSYDVGVNALSKGSNQWDIYFTRNADKVIHLGLDGGFTLVGYNIDPGGYYVINLSDSLTVVSMVPNGTTPVWTDANPPDGTVSTPYTYTFKATGATAYSVNVGDSLPPGLSLNGATGVMSGTPTTGGRYKFKIIAHNSAGDTLSPLCDMNIIGAPVWVNKTPPGGTVGVAYSYTFKATGFPKPTYAVTSGTLPAGLSLDSTIGILSGTPTTATTYNFHITASNSGGTSDSGALSIIIASGGGGGTPPTWIADTPPTTGFVGDDYSYLFRASGNPAPTFSVFSGTLPTGLSLTAGGLLSGTLSSAGVFTFVIAATNSAGTINSPTLQVTVSVKPVPPIWVQDDPIDGLKGSAYTYTFVANGTPTPTYALKGGSGSLPPGLALNSTTGVLSGTPTASGQFLFIITASNSAGDTDTPVITMNINDAPAWTANTPPGGTVGIAYSYTFTASGYPTPTFSIISGAVPSGLTFDINGNLSGTPDTAATYNFTVQADNGIGSPVTAARTVIIGSGSGTPTPPVFVLFDPPDGTVSTTYTYTFTATGYPAPAFSLGSGTIPLGLILTPDGIMSGTPTARGTYNFTIIATNSAGTVETPQITMKIVSGVRGQAVFHKVFPLVESRDHCIRFNNVVAATFPCVSPLYVNGSEKKAFSLEAWTIYLPKPAGTNSDQVVVGSYQSTDGLIVNGKKVTFCVAFDTAPSSSITYEAPTYERMHIVGTYEVTRVKLFVNGVLVGSQDLSDAQQAASFISTDNNFYAGWNPGGQSIAIQDVAIYDKALSPDQVLEHFNMAFPENTADQVTAYNPGNNIEITREFSDIFNDMIFNDADSWLTGQMNNCVILENKLLPMMDEDGLTTAGTWMIPVHIEPPDGATQIYGAVASWEAIGATVSMSLDGEFWSPLRSDVRSNLISAGMDPTGIDAYIMIEFTAGLEEAYINWLQIDAIETGTMDTVTGRTVTISGNCTPNYDYEPFLQQDNIGLYLTGGTLTITPDSDPAVLPPQTIEIWVKMLNAKNLKVMVGSNLFDDPTDGVQYTNGNRDPAQPNVGEWSLLHLVTDTPITDNITITHDNLIISRIVLYSAPLNDDQVDEIYAAYTGTAILQLDDGGTVDVNDPSSNEAIVYYHDWTITGAG